MSAAASHEQSIDALVRELADALRRHGRRLATAESCSGGLVAAACTTLAGSSDWFDRGIVSYSNAAKHDLLGVPVALIDAHGAVSEAVARAMVDGLLRASAADLGVAVTGIAGPTGGSAAKPVGTVWFGFGVRRADGSVATEAEHVHFDGDRAAVREASVRHALQRLVEHAQALPRR